MSEANPISAALAQNSKAWPFEEARRLMKRYEKSGFPEEVLFETGYGPSGLPHIGTFGEVARTSMVRHAFEVLTEGSVKTRLICFSDDMDGMRKIPDNVPDRSLLEPYLHMPLTSVPNPFGGDHESFGHHNNAMLRRFLDTFGFDYQFESATEFYQSGRFDPILRKVAEKYEKIMEIMLPTLGEERRATYSPFLPISPKSGRVLYVPVSNVNAVDATIDYTDEDGEEITQSILGGQVKLQWKPDFGARWAALGIDFEMFGKDHGPNMKVYDRICSALGGRPPEHFVYELFLDDKGEKISKSKGNGLTIDEWLEYASPESLSLFMFQKPKTAKRLYFDVIPRQVDEYYQHLSAVHGQEPEKKLQNPAWHIHSGNPPEAEMPISYSMLLNLVSASNSNEKETLWGFISQYEEGLSAETHPELDRLVGYAIRYFEDFVKPNKSFRAPTEQEEGALRDLAEKLSTLPKNADAETIQTEVFTVGKDHGFENLREWFQALYQILLGQDQGPRFGSFVALYGIDKTLALVEAGLNGELTQGA